MSIWDDFKKGLKGDKEYQAAKAKKKASRKVKAKNQRAKLDALRKKTKAVKTPSSKVSKAKEEVKPNLTKPKPKVPKAKKEAANKSWSKATKSAKASGVKMTDLIKARNAAKKSGDKTAYAKAQNQINKHYGSKKEHKVVESKKDDRPIKITAKTDARPKKEKKPTVHKPMTPSKSEGLGGKQKAKTQGISKSKYDKKKKISDDATKRHEQMLKKEATKKSKKPSMPVAGPNYKTNPEKIAGPPKGLLTKPYKPESTEDETVKLLQDKGIIEPMEQGGIVNDMKPQYGSGGKVEGGGLFNFPTKDSRKR